MKILIGVDRTEECRAACELVAMLRFPKPEVELLHVIERLEPVTWGELPPDAGLIERLLARQQDEGHAYQSAAMERLEPHGIQANVSMRQGFAANELIARATAGHFDLLATGCEGKGDIPGLLYGSVSRKLTIAAHCSLLIAKRARVPDRPFNAVFATDHSDYANACVDLLAKFAPQGLNRLTVMTAYPKTLIGAMRAVLDHFKSDVGEWVERQLELQNQSVIARLGPLGCTFQSRIIDLAPQAAIEHALREAEADLLILGAQGHGFLDRVTAGSISFDQAVKGKHHLLILRT